ncbi:hypothetical protein JCM3765_000222 [Sporobolomyces pararoseus]
MPIPSLPNELVDQILSYECLKEEDSLVKTCLVSKSWLEPSRKWMYQNVWISLCTVEGAEKNPYGPRPTNYLERSSFKLFSLLTQRPEVAHLTKKICLGISRNAEPHEISGLSTTLPDLLTSLLRLLPSVTYVYFDDDEWFHQDSIGLLFPYFYRLEAIEIEECMQTAWFDLVGKLPNLKSLTLNCVATGELLSSNPALNPGITGLRHLAIRHCGARALANLSTGSWPFLLSLRITLDLLPQLDLSRCPNLGQLTVDDGTSTPRWSEIKTFLQQLKTSNIVKLSLSIKTVRLFECWSSLSSYVPQSCLRIDLEGRLTLDGVAAAVETQVAQLGLLHPTETVRRRNGRERTIVEALRAMMDGTGIEIIWR